VEDSDGEKAGGKQLIASYKGNELLTRNR